MQPSSFQSEGILLHRGAFGNNVETMLCFTAEGAPPASGGKRPGMMLNVL